MKNEMNFVNCEKFYRIGYGIEELYYVGKNPMLLNYYIFSDKSGEIIESIHEEKIKQSLFENVNDAIGNKIKIQRENYPDIEFINGIHINDLLKSWYEYQKLINKID